MKNKKNGELSRTFWYIIVAICLVLIIFIGVMFFMFANRKDEIIEKELNGGNIQLNYTNNITGLSIVKAVPITDAIGMKSDKEGQFFDFSLDIEVDEASVIEYEIAAIKNETASTINNEDIRIYLEKEESGTYSKIFGPQEYKPLEKDSKLGSPEGSMVLVKDKTKDSLKDNYRLRMWLSNKSLTKNGNYSVEIVVNGIAK